MKLLYITNARIPTEKAYGLQTVSMCQAFAKAGADVTLMIPRRRNPVEQDVFRYYGLSESFTVRYVPIVDAIDFGRRFGFFITRLSYALVLTYSSELPRQSESVIFTRDLISAFLLKRRGYDVFYDMHGFPYRWLWFWKKVCLALNGIICTNQWKIEQCKRIFCLPDDRLLLARNGYNAFLFAKPTAQDKARGKLGLSLGKKLAVYTGNFYDWKGTAVVIESARILRDVFFLLVGGKEIDLEQLRKQYQGNKNIIFIGQKPHQEIPLYLWAADVLLLPNSARSFIPRFAIYSQYDTSPLKLFEYMSAGRPIVASALPSIKEILHAKNSVLVEPDNPHALAHGIKTILENKDLAEKLQNQSRCDVQRYTLDNRARIILNFINSLSNARV